MRIPRITRLGLILMVLGVCMAGALFMRMRGGAADELVLPSIGDVDGQVEIDRTEPIDDEPAVADDADQVAEAEELDVEELDSSADDALFADDGERPAATGIDPLTGRIETGGNILGDDSAEDATDADIIDGGDANDATDSATDAGNLESDPDPLTAGVDDADASIEDADGQALEGAAGDADDPNHSIVGVDDLDAFDVDGPGGPVAFVDGDRDASAFTDDDERSVVVLDDDGPTGGFVLGQNGAVDNGLGVAVIDDPELGGSGADAPSPTPTPEARPLADRADTDAAQARLEAWLDEMGVAGARIGLSFPDGSTALLVAGTNDDGTPIAADDTFLATSITKTMTASIIFELISQGALTLDTPAPELEVLPDFAYAGDFTIRQLLQHTTGLVPYQRSPNWDQAASIDPVQALALADDVPLEWTPGAQRGYSNSGYIYLGLLAEQITGTDYEQLLNGLLDPVGTENTDIDDTARSGWVGFSAGGLVSNVPDLLSWGSALYRERSVLEPQQLNAMLDVNNEHSTGLGANVICPCGLTDGQLWYTSIGHDGGSVTLQHSPSDAMVVAGKFSESFWTDELSQVDVHRLLRDLRAIVRPG